MRLGLAATAIEAGLPRCSRSAVRVLVATLSIFGPLVASADEDPVFSSGRRFEQRSGEAIYRSICQGCHMPDGRGAQGAGIYPKLASNAALASPEVPVIIVLRGRRNMPSFARSLDDAQVAAVVSYVRSHLGNNFTEPVTARQVAALR